MSISGLGLKTKNQPNQKVSLKAFVFLALFAFLLSPLPFCSPQK